MTYPSPTHRHRVFLSREQALTSRQVSQIPCDFFETLKSQAIVYVLKSLPARDLFHHIVRRLVRIMAMPKSIMNKLLARHFPSGTHLSSINTKCSNAGGQPIKGLGGIQIEALAISHQSYSLCQSCRPTLSTKRRT